MENQFDPTADAMRSPSPSPEPERNNYINEDETLFHRDGVSTSSDCPVLLFNLTRNHMGACEIKKMKEYFFKKMIGLR